MGNKGKVLLVDDEPDVVQVVGTHLRTAGYQVSMAYDAQHALDEVRRDRPDVVILDIMLPKVDGDKVCRLLKFDERYKEIPVLVLTARSNAEDLKLATDYGASACLNKPFEPSILLGMLEKLMAGSVQPRAEQQKGE